MSPQKPRCPVCGKRPTPEHKPFCSKRCADIDLGRWLTESYSLAETPSDDEESPEDDG
jgi:endogenous inhibitor of DNA gyrase (YacG/DUF329 family)